MSANDGGYTTIGLGSLALRPASRTNAAIEWYVSPSLGNDLTGKGTQASPYATMEKIESLLPDVVNHRVRVHMRGEQYVLPDRGYFLRSRIHNELIMFVADESWDPNVYNIVGGNRIAAAATTGSVIKAAGLVVNALQDLSIRFTTGDAAGQYRRVRNNTATDIIPGEAFDPAPAPGDTYQIFSDKAAFVLPTLPNDRFVNMYCFGGDAPSLPVTPFWEGSQLRGGVVLAGVALVGSPSYFAYQFGAMQLLMWGVDAIDGFADDILNELQFSFMGTRVFSGYGLGGDLSLRSEFGPKYGWGLRCLMFGGGSNKLQFSGYLNTDHIGSDESDSGDIMLFGGHASRVWMGALWGAGISSGLTSGHCFLAIEGGGAIAFLVDGSGDPAPGSPYLSAVGDCVIESRALDIRGAVIISGGARFYLWGGNTNSTIGTGPITVTSQGGIYCVNGGAMSLGDAVANDWTVTGLAAFNKSALAAGGSFKFGTDGALATKL